MRRWWREADDRFLAIAFPVIFLLMLAALIQLLIYIPQTPNRHNKHDDIIERLNHIEQRLAQTPASSPAPLPRVSPSAASRSRAAPPRPASELWAARPDVRALRLCESGDRLHAVSPSGKYHGLYQSTASWAYGSRMEQNRGAWILWRTHGAAPWPNCGKVLK